MSDFRMTTAARSDLHALVDALPTGEEQAARRYLEYLRAASDPFASLTSMALS
jgi:plasmid stabilization system protein ParE